MAGMTVSSLTAAGTCGDTTIAVAAVTNLKPGMGIIIGVTEWAKVANTYAGSTTVPLDGVLRRNHASGAPVQWDGSTAPTIS